VWRWGQTNTKRKIQGSDNTNLSHSNPDLRRLSPKCCQIQIVCTQSLHPEKGGLFVRSSRMKAFEKISEFLRSLLVSTQIHVQARNPGSRTLISIASSVSWSEHHLTCCGTASGPGNLPSPWFPSVYFPKFTSHSSREFFLAWAPFHRSQNSARTSLSVLHHHHAFLNGPPTKLIPYRQGQDFIHFVCPETNVGQYKHLWIQLIKMTTKVDLGLEPAAVDVVQGSFSSLGHMNFK
jgi:hypothetical protein